MDRGRIGSKERNHGKPIRKRCEKVGHRTGTQKKTEKRLCNTNREGGKFFRGEGNESLKKKKKISGGHGGGGGGRRGNALAGWRDVAIPLRGETKARHEQVTRGTGEI